MQLVVFLLAYPVLRLISILPKPLFYGFSDIAFVLIFYLARYRRKVVQENLRLALPELSEEERRQVEKKFYRHLCDLFLEMVKTMDLSKKEVAKRYHILNPELIQNLEKERSVLVLCTHYANWEWNTSINNVVSSRGFAIYQKIGNKYFDRLIRKIRAKWNTDPIEQKNTVKRMYENERNGVRGVYGIVNDQSPMMSKAQYWSPFMGITVPIFVGAESLAKKLDLATVFLKVTKVKRGYYQAEFIPINAKGSTAGEHEITEKFLRLSEQQIREQPEYYLWTHRRWKHKDKAPQA
ncbi:MAG: lysophospholipid acyltransferase family protein [Flavobacteriaceae bacterium]|nr:lysophospholipid acyltransferase family protein [Muriicola sp.]NNC62612.1 lysophospholipid acyltransferase family protein [Eudoraea sp.]NNK20185.1 lysophospholipid acyltransferase family protein [Flavobacteriaceae bacterium]MBT8289784.1 lysophospholipid acyltransferase family protein [Muriicola sp.]NNK34978.1 lysophospholipid acyltransferase family protein [Eudoraea sp.]